MVLRAKDVGESECYPVMGWIGPPSGGDTQPERVLTSNGSCSTRKSGKPSSQGKADDGELSLWQPCWCALKLWLGGSRSVSCREDRILILLNRVPHGTFARLEPSTVKVVRAVLRGGGGGNTASLPDHWTWPVARPLSFSVTL